LADDIYLSISNTGNLAYYGATYQIGINCIVRVGETYFSWNLAVRLAHELNNPAAAAAGRVTTQLHQIFQTLPSLSIKIYQRKDMTPEQLVYVSNLEYDLTRDYTSKKSSSFVIMTLVINTRVSTYFQQPIIYLLEFYCIFHKTYHP
jgi:hypothetical protein